MTFLILSQNDKFLKVISQNVNIADKSNKIYTSDFSAKSIKKSIKYLKNLSILIIFNEGNATLSTQELCSLSSLVGYCISQNVLILTNIKPLYELPFFSLTQLLFFENESEIVNYLSSNYDKILSEDEKKQAQKKLLDKGLPFTPDSFATYIEKNKSDICNLFILGGIDINSRNDLGTPLINVAVRNDNVDLVKKFIELGADINIVSEDRGYTPIMDAVWRGNLELTKLFIKHGAQLNTISKEGQSNLVLAVGADKTKIVQVLAKAGADPDIKDQMGMSAYGYASLFKKEEILKILEPYHKS